MAGSLVVTGLKRQRAKILAEIARLEGVIAGHRADILHLEAIAITVCSGKRFYEPQTPKRLFQRGQVGQVVFAALRRAERPLSTAEIAGLIAPGSEPRTRKATIKTVGKSLAKFRQRGHVIGERKGNMTWWRLPLPQNSASLDFGLDLHDARGSGCALEGPKSSLVFCCYTLLSSLARFFNQNRYFPRPTKVRTIANPAMLNTAIIVCGGSGCFLNSISFFSAWIAAFTIVLAVATIGLLKVGNRTLVETDRALKITQRAYLEAKRGGIEVSGDNQVVGQVIFFNAGALPARNVTVSARIKWCESRDVEEFSEAHIPQRTHILPAKSELQTGTRSLEDGHDRLNDGFGFIYVWGRATYDDGFGCKRWLTFCPGYNCGSGTINEFAISPKNGRMHHYYNDGN